MATRGSVRRLRPQARSLARRVVDRVSAPVGSVVSVSTSAPWVALTYDDGPDPVGTPAALEVLARHGATATFFMLLTRVRRHPDLVAAVLDAGHEVALHGLDHRRLTSLAPAEARRRVGAGKVELEERAGVQVRWFRPPYGAQNLAVWRAARSAQMQSVFWGPSLWDWKDTTDAARTAKSLQALAAGAIVLAHDGIAGPADAAEEGEPVLPLDRSAWWDAALTRYAAEGLAARSLGEVVDQGRTVRAARFTR
jgi:peptidoglycan/xylan/chitin deacetylase (PgdA/CDA1 family)